MKRRGFLAGILAAGVAPAIVHNPMKIFVPKQDIVVPNLGRGLTSAIYHVDEAPFQSAYSLTRPAIRRNSPSGWRRTSASVAHHVDLRPWSNACRRGVD